MDNAKEELTHDQIWDDSELVDSWNEALEEYKKYHSIAARGEKVESKFTQPAAPQPISRSHASESDPTSHAPPNFIAAPLLAAQPGSSPTAPTANSSLAGLPQTLIGPAPDENLKNIMMSWYYAGYYTGLYEGQQKAWAQMQGQD